MALPRVFASGVYGSDYDRWGAWSFTDPGTRDKLRATIDTDRDFVLAIGMMRETPEHERGRLLALLKIAPEPILTADLVEPEHWRQSLARYGERWLYGFPIRSVERFDGLPHRSLILPRIDQENLYRVVGRHYVELRPDEVRRVLALPRTPDTNIYSSPVSAFATRLRNRGKGPPPQSGVRTLTSKSGAAATYLLVLVGPAASEVVRPLELRPSDSVLKLGFSNNPERRLREINGYLPCLEALCWRVVRMQWHDDEINAWAMEQRIFELLEQEDANRFKGEMLAVSLPTLDAAWKTALETTQRPTGPVVIPIGES